MGRVWRDTPSRDGGHLAREWGRKARKEEDRIRGLNNQAVGLNQAHRAAVQEQMEEMEEEG